MQFRDIQLNRGKKNMLKIMPWFMKRFGKDYIKKLNDKAANPLVEPAKEGNKINFRNKKRFDRT